jgi:hypothetical protein
LFQDRKKQSWHSVLHFLAHGKNVSCLCSPESNYRQKKCFRAETGKWSQCHADLIIQRGKTAICFVNRESVAHFIFFLPTMLSQGCHKATWISQTWLFDLCRQLYPSYKVRLGCSDTPSSPRLYFFNQCLWYLLGRNYYWCKPSF